MQFSERVLKAMGFQTNDQEIEFTAAFVGLYVFEIHGITLAAGNTAKIDGEIAGINYSAAIGMTVNKLSALLIDDDYTDDESSWQKEKKCHAPYLMVRFGPTSLHSATPRHWTIQHGEFHTLDAFGQAKSELKSFEDKALAGIVTATVVALSDSGQPQVRMRHMDTTLCGKTIDGKWLHDIRFSASLAARVSTSITSEVLARSLNTAKTMADSIDPKVAKFYYMALAEDDPLKRFLYFFLSIEVQIHRTFGRISHRAHLADLNYPTDRIKLSSASFFGDSVKNWANVKDRFLWCAHCVWTDLNQADVIEFARLKRIRDGIAHGEVDQMNSIDVPAVEKFAVRFQQQA